MPPEDGDNYKLYYLSWPLAFHPQPVKETEVNLFSTTEYEKKKAKLTPQHPHSHSGLSPSCHLLIQEMGRGT